MTPFFIKIRWLMLPNRCGALPGGLFLKQISFFDCIRKLFFSHYMTGNDFRGKCYFNCTRQVNRGSVLFWLYQTGQNRGLSQRPCWLWRGFVAVRLSPAKSGHGASHDVTASSLINFKIRKGDPCDTIWGPSGASLLALIRPVLPHPTDHWSHIGGFPSPCSIN